MRIIGGQDLLHNRRITPGPERRGTSRLLNQPQPLQTRVPVLADNDVVVHGIPNGVATSTIACVIVMSACDGVGSPDGWLCTILPHALPPFLISAFSGSTLNRPTALADQQE
jgi:hypothetical protein